jgi:hypothetical protein
MMNRPAVLGMIATLCLSAAPDVPGAQPITGLVTGADFAAGANLAEKNVKAQGTIFLPDDARRVRAVIVLAESWPGTERGVYDASGRKQDDADVPLRLRRPAGQPAEPDLAVGRFRDRAWRRLAAACECGLLHLRLGTIRPEPAAGQAVNGMVIHNGIPNRVIRTAAEGGADALFIILQQLGQDSAHKELKDAPLLLWGWSAAASFGTTFAEIYPERTVAFIRYHSHLRGLSPNLKVLKDIPALLIAGGRDETAGTEDAETLWKSARSAGAPWTLAIEPGAAHAGEDSFVSSQVLMLPWIAAVIRQRVAPGMTRLRLIAHDSGWLGQNDTGEIAPYATFAAPTEKASWLPDEIAARGWQTVVRGHP